MKQYLKLTYLCNAGVMIEDAQHKLLIDFFCVSNKNGLYRPLDPSILESIQSGQPPFDRVQFLMFTHDHDDHFSADLTSCILENKQDINIISTNQIIERINYMQGAANDCGTSDFKITASQSIYFNSLSITIYPLLHSGAKYKEDQHLAFLINLNGKTVFHVGDASVDESNYNALNLNETDIDLLIAPFPYVGTPSGHKIIKDFIKPKKIAVVHLPRPEADKEGWIKSMHRYFSKRTHDFPATSFLETPMESIWL